MNFQLLDVHGHHSRSFGPHIRCGSGFTPDETLLFYPGFGHTVNPPVTRTRAVTMSVWDPAAGPPGLLNAEQFIAIHTAPPCGLS